MLSNSMIYSPRIKEIEEKISSMIEKFEINSQYEKGKLLFSLICRLKTMFESKKVNPEILFNTIYILILLSNSPLHTTLDIEMMRERFEERYIRLECNKIMRNVNHNKEDLNFERTVKFEEVDYNEPSSDYESDKSINNDETLIKKGQEENKICEPVTECKFSGVSMPPSKIISRKIFSRGVFSEEIEISTQGHINMKTNYKPKLIKIDRKRFQLSNFLKCIQNSHFNKIPFTISKSTDIPSLNLSRYGKSLIDHLFKINMRYEKEKLIELTNLYYQKFHRNLKLKNCVALENLQNNYLLFEYSSVKSSNNKIDDINENFSISKIIVNSDFLLNSIIINLLIFDFDTIIIEKESKNKAYEAKYSYNYSNEYFFRKFKNYTCLDINMEIFSKILNDFNIIRDNINFLRQIEMIFERHEIFSVITKKFTAIIKEFIIYHDKVLDSLIKLINYQKGKISVDSKAILFVNEIEKSTDLMLFISEFIFEHNNYINELIKDNYKNNKFTLLKFKSYYENNIMPIIRYFINISENILTIKFKNKNTDISNSNNTLCLKEITDFIYNFTKNKCANTIHKKDFLLYIEVLFEIFDSYLQIVFEFILNGNLIDVYNEFFIDHTITKKDAKKFIFNFNDKFQDFNWIESFKIKSHTYGGVSDACVPSLFMIDNIYFKILETSKSTFLLKNLKNSNKINFEIGEDLVSGGTNFISKIRKFLKEEMNILQTHSQHNLNLGYINLKNNVNTVECSNLGSSSIENKWDEITNNIINKCSNSIQNSECIPFSGTEVENLNLKFNQNYKKLDFISERNTILQNNNNMNFISSNNLDTNDIIEHKTFKLNVVNKENSNSEMSNLVNILNDAEVNLDKSITLTTYSENYLSYDPELIVRKIIFTQLININKLINEKLLNYLINEENLIKNHFNVAFKIFLFQAGFSMNKFIIDLHEFTLNCKELKNDNFYLKNLIDELTINSDLNKNKLYINNYVNIIFNTENSSVTHTNYDFIKIDYLPKLPLNIFFDNNIIGFYNSIFNFIVKIKRTNLVIRNFELYPFKSRIDKNLKILFDRCSDSNCDLNIVMIKKILKYFINLRMLIFNFLSNLEFHIFYNVIDKKIKKFIKKISDLKSIDSMINSHFKFVREIDYFLGIKDEKMMKALFKILNIISNLTIVINKLFIFVGEDLINEDYNKNRNVNTNNILEKIYIEILNLTDRFNKKECKFEVILEKYKEKAKN